MAENLCVAGVIAVVGLFPSSSYADAEYKGEYCKVEFNLKGNRWDLTRSRKSIKRGWTLLRISDANDIASILFMGQARDRNKKCATIDEWFDRKISVRRLKAYGQDYFHIVSEKRNEATLGSGERVKVVSYYLSIKNQYDRNVRFAYFSDREETHGHYLMVSNRGVHEDQDRSFKEILQGIKIRH